MQQSRTYKTTVKDAFCPVPDMTYNVFGGSLSLTQSIRRILLSVTSSNSSVQRVYTLAATDKAHFLDLSECYQCCSTITQMKGLSRWKITSIISAARSVIIITYYCTGTVYSS